MNNKDYSRRQFLKTFAALSSAPLLVTMLSACGSSESAPPVSYGPYPPTGVNVNGMTFLDAQSNQVLLAGNQAVPVHTSFIIQFNVPMNASATVSATTLADSSSASVAFATSWDQYGQLVTITPAADLSANTVYTLSVNDTATDSNGTRLTVNANSTASFKTA